MFRTTKFQTLPPCLLRRTLVAAFISCTLAFLAVTVSAPANAAVAPVGTGNNQEIRNKQNTLCLDDYGFNTQPGAEVRQWTCLEGTNQLWAVTDLGTGYAEIQNKYSNLCLENTNSSRSAGAPVRQATCKRTSSSQHWKLTDVGSGWTEIRNRVNNLCLESEASPADGTTLRQFTCGNTAVQRWALTDPNIAKLTYVLHRSQNPSTDELDAYARITEAMDRAVARYNKFDNFQRQLSVYYSPGVPTAEANSDGIISFGSDRAYMIEAVALHEMAHVHGVGTTWYFQNKCDAQDWPAALPLLRLWDGPNAVITCSNSHMRPYGLNTAEEDSEINFDRSARLVQAMRHDGL